MGAEVLVFWAEEFWPDRAIVLGQCAVLIAGILGKSLAEANPQRFYRIPPKFLPIIAAALVTTVAFVLVFDRALAAALPVVFIYEFAAAIVGAIAVAVALVIAGVVTVAGASAFAVAFALAVVFALGEVIELLEIVEGRCPTGR